VILSACAGTGGQPLPLPIPRAGDGGLPGREVLIELGRKQSYDPNPGASHRAIVENGIEVTVEPQDGAYRQTETRLGMGAIVATLTNHSPKPLPAYALGPSGRSFWIVYRKGTEWFSAYIGDSRNGKLDRFDVPTMIHVPTRPWRQSIAQWQLTEVLEKSRPGDGTLLASEVVPWVTCMELGCCRPGR
jgi:hypothetical protein